MLKKLLTGCLTFAAVAALAVPAMAETSFNGRVRSYLANESQVSAGDSAGSIMQFQSDARFGGTASGEAGSFTASAKLELDMGVGFGEGEVAADPSVRQAWIKLASDAFSVQLGRDLPFGTYYLPKYAEFVVPVNTFWIGENVNNARADYLVFGIPNIGPGNLEFVYGMNSYGHDSDSTTDQYDEQTISARWKGAFGAVGLQVQYSTQSRSVDTETGSAYAGIEDSTYDGASLSLMALAVSFDINDMMGVGLNYESKSETPGGSGAEAATTMSYELFFNMGLSETMGLSVGYGGKSYKANPDADATDTTTIALCAANQMGAVKLFGGYYSYSSSTDGGDPSGATMIAVGMNVGF